MSTPLHLHSPLRQKVREGCGNLPGVYRWLCRGEPVYIGRSRTLRTRLLSYFRADEGSKSSLVVAASDDLIWEETPSEFASHLAELRLIKEIRPSYNRALKDDRDYVFIKVGPGPAPRLVVTPQPTPYGPFRSPRRVTEAVRRLSDILQLRTSPESMKLLDPRQQDLFNVARRPQCLRGQIGLCAAPCAGRAPFDEYALRLEKARQFLLGRETALIDDLRAKMREASLRMEFERASVYRDRLVEIEGLARALGSLRESLDKLTFVYAVPGRDGHSDLLYFVRGGRVIGTLPRCRGHRQVAAAEELAQRLLERAPPPGSGDEMDEIRVVASWFRARPEELARTRSAHEFLRDPRAWPEVAEAPRVIVIDLPEVGLPGEPAA